MRKILFGLFMVAVVLSNVGCKSKGGESTTTVGSPGCGCGH
jgi:hypothetical protein